MEKASSSNGKHTCVNIQIISTHDTEHTFTLTHTHLLIPIYTQHTHTAPKKVHVITSQGHVLATYDSAHSAQRKMGANDSHIGKACVGKLPRVNGFLWRYAEPNALLNERTLEELQEATRGAIEKGEHLEAVVVKRKQAAKIFKVNTHSHTHTHK